MDTGKQKGGSESRGETGVMYLLGEQTDGQPREKRNAGQEVRRDRKLVGEMKLSQSPRHVGAQ